MSVGAGLESRATRAKALSTEACRAGENGRSTCVGSAPQADSRTDTRNATEPRSRDTTNLDALNEIAMGEVLTDTLFHLTNLRSVGRDETVIARRGTTNRTKVSVDESEPTKIGSAFY